MTRSAAPIGWTVAWPQSLATFASPFVRTHAPFVTALVPNDAEMLLTRAMATDWPGRSAGDDRVHVTTCAFAVQVKPAPAALTNDSPAGSVSETTIGSVVAAVPTFLTVSVNGAWPPTGT